MVVVVVVVVVVNMVSCCLICFQAQLVQKWKWLPADFSEKAGDLTPTLKLKRSVVSEKYGALIESIYEGTSD